MFAALLICFGEILFSKLNADLINYRCVLVVLNSLSQSEDLIIEKFIGKIKLLFLEAGGTFDFSVV